jgi:hypothetical protein
LVAATPVKKPKKSQFFGGKKSFSKGHGHGKNHENHVPVPVLPENARARALFGWFSKSRAHVRARALFPPKWACPRALGPCPYTPGFRPLFLDDHSTRFVQGL